MANLVCSDLGKQLQLPKSTVHRLASTLVEAGMLEQNAESGKYRLGLAVFELGSLVRRKMTLPSIALRLSKGGAPPEAKFKESPQKTLMNH